MEARAEAHGSSGLFGQLLHTRHPWAAPTYDARLLRWDFVPIVVAGAGAVGCEVLRLLAASGFGAITIIDDDHVERCNLPRQLLYREGDVGRPKARAAAEALRRQFPRVEARALVARVEDVEDAVWAAAEVVVLALDSVESRRAANRRVVEAAARWERVGEAQGQRLWRRIAAAPLLLDIGTEGFAAHCRRIDLAGNASPCVECSLYLFPPAAKTRPLCAARGVPRTIDQCVFLAQQRLLADGDDAAAEGSEGMQRIAAAAQALQRGAGLTGPPIDATTARRLLADAVPTFGAVCALAAGQAASEALKALIGIGPVLRNFALYTGDAAYGGVHSTVVALKGPSIGSGADGHVCPVCGPRPIAVLHGSMTPSAVQRCIAAVVGQWCGGGMADTNRSVALCFVDVDDPAAAGIGPGRRPAREVLLAYASDSPLVMTPLPGGSVAEILATHGAQRFYAAWKAGLATATVLWCAKGAGTTALCLSAECREDDDEAAVSAF